MTIEHESDPARIETILETHATFAADQPGGRENHVTLADCGRMHALRDEGYSHTQIADRVDWKAHTVTYHLQDRCDHARADTVSRAECGEINSLRSCGNTWARIARTVDIDRQTAKRHAKGNCSHAHEEVGP